MQVLKRRGDALLCEDIMDGQSVYYYVLLHGKKLLVTDTKGPVITKAIIAHLCNVANSSGVLIMNDTPVTLLKFGEKEIVIGLGERQVIICDDAPVRAGIHFVQIGEYRFHVYAPLRIL